MDARLFALPYSAQVAVRDAFRVLVNAQRVLAQKQRRAKRAAWFSEGANTRAKRLQEQMGVVVRGTAR
jgi:hypothetical protein